MKKLVAFLLLFIAPVALAQSGPRGVRHTWVEQTPNPTGTPGVEEIRINGPKNATTTVTLDLEITGPCSASAPWLTIVDASPNDELRCAPTPTATATATPTATPTPTATGTPPTPTPTSTPTPTPTPGSSGSALMLIARTTDTLDTSGGFDHFAVSGPSVAQNDSDQVTMRTEAMTPTKVACALIGGTPGSGKSYVFTLIGASTWSCTIANSATTCSDTSGDPISEGDLYWRAVASGTPSAVYATCRIIGAI